LTTPHCSSKGNFFKKAAAANVQRAHCTYLASASQRKACIRSIAFYSIMWTRSQSGQIQVGPLLMPHLFSSKQLGQIWKPQPQFQQKGCSSLQQ
jgi:hypothetical protein